MQTQPQGPPIENSQKDQEALHTISKLERLLAERTAELEQRATELAIVNSVQQGLAQQLDMQAMYDLVGDQIRDIFDAQGVGINIYDPQTDLLSYPYLIERGERFFVEPEPLGTAGFSPYIIRTRQPLMFNSDLSQRATEYGSYVLGDTQQPKSYVGVPLVVGDAARGIITLQNVDRENAFSESDLRLLSTLASSLSVALENTRLFAETKRLLAETEQRNAELAIINSVQQGLAQQLDMQAIIDLVGDQIRDIFDAQVLVITIYDPQTNLLSFPYGIERSERFYLEPRALTAGGFTPHIIRTRQPLMFNRDLAQRVTEFGSYVLGDTQVSKSYLAVPLVVGDAARGIITLENIDREHAFSDSDLRLLSTLASSLSVALENARLFAETKRLLAETEQRNAELAIINSVQQGLAQQLDMQAIIDLVGDQIRDIFDAQVVSINIYDPQTNLVHHPYVIERGERFYLEPTPLISTGFSPYIIRTRQPLMFNRDLAQRVTEFGSYVLGDTQVSKSYLGVPLVVGDETRGVITLENLDRENAFSESDLRLLSTLASNLSVALENVRLLQETRRRANEMTVLAEIGQDIATASDLDAVLERIATQAKALLHVRDIAIYLWQLDEQAFRAKVAQGQYVAEIKSEPILFDKGITGQIARSGMAEIVNYPENDPRAIRIPGTPAIDEELEGLMCAPLRLRDRIIGLITVWRVRTNGLFEQADLDFLVSLARQAAIAIENARLYLETQRHADQMAALAEVGRDISATLDLAMVLERIARHAQDLLASETSAVYLPEPGGRTFRAIAVLGADAEAIRNDTITLGVGIIGDLARRGTAEVIHDVTRDPRARPIPGTPQQESEQLMAAPLLAGERVMGMMVVWRTGQRVPFTEDDLDFLGGLARQAAIAIENARLFEEARQATAAAEAANLAKSTFLANMSHELRTPLNAVLGFAQVMERDPALSPRQSEHLGIITRSGEHLLGLINDVLEVSKIEAGRVTLNQAPFDLHALLRSVEELFRFRAEAKNIRFLYEIAPDVPQYVTGDESKLRQVLINLLGNAVKFTHEGHVTLRAAWHDQRPATSDQRPPTTDQPVVVRRSSFVVEVADTGEGIAADQLPHLFEAFVQTASGTKSHEGSGLGLAISRQFVQLMGGDITVKSVVGQGSFFRFEVRLAPADSSALRQEAKRRVVGIAPEWQGEQRMLVVDDKWENRRLLVEWLELVGFQVREAGNGAEAIAIWEDWAPQMVWMDMRMPVMDGYEATRRIKATLKGQATVVIALTASAFEHEQAVVLEAGCDDFVRKPVREEVIFEKITQHLGVQFVYAELEAVHSLEDGAALTPAALAGLPAELAASLRQAVLMADIDKVKVLIGQIHDRDAVLAERLRYLAENFQIDQLHALVQA